MKPNLNQPALLATTVALAAPRPPLGGAGIPIHLAMWLIVPEQTEGVVGGWGRKPWRKLTTRVDLGRAPRFASGPNRSSVDGSVCCGLRRQLLNSDLDI